MPKHYSSKGSVVNVVHTNSSGSNVVHAPLYEAATATEAATIANLLNSETFRAREDLKLQIFAVVDKTNAEHQHALRKTKLDS